MTYLDIVRCPKCVGELRQISATQLACNGCGDTYSIEDGIPVLLTSAERDLVSEEIKSWYERNWTGGAETKAKRLHEDVSSLGQKYIQESEQAFIDEMAKRTGRYFLDIGSGAQPRVAAGQGHDFHVCMDLSLAGLQQSRKILGGRGMFVIGSAINPPLAKGIAFTILAAHCIYHIDKNLQPEAIGKLHSLLADNGRMFIFYANPQSFEKLALLPLRLVKHALRPKRTEAAIYFEPLSMGKMAKIFDSTGATWSVRALRFFSRTISQPAFNLPGRSAIYSLFRAMSRLSTYLNAYIVYTLHR